MDKDLEAEVIRGLLNSSVEAHSQLLVAKAAIQIVIAALDAPAKSSIRQGLKEIAEHLLSQAAESRHGIAQGAMISAEINQYLTVAK